MTAKTGNSSVAENLVRLFVMSLAFMILMLLPISLVNPGPDSALVTWPFNVVEWLFVASASIVIGLGIFFAFFGLIAVLWFDED